MHTGPGHGPGPRFGPGPAGSAKIAVTFPAGPGPGPGPRLGLGPAPTHIGESQRSLRVARPAGVRVRAPVPGPAARGFWVARGPSGCHLTVPVARRGMARSKDQAPGPPDGPLPALVRWRLRRPDLAFSTSRKSRDLGVLRVLKRSFAKLTEAAVNDMVNGQQRK